MSKSQNSIEEIKEHAKALASELGSLALKYSKLEAENKRLHNELMGVISSNAGWMNEAKEREAENQRLRDAIEEARTIMVVATGWAPDCLDIEQEAGE
ncbi:hypothetical protein [Rhodobacteraceae phage LS06-2018-MD07]|jgi:CRISPR/Cas system CMR-associated protein Cmr5 small subunit|nr:hypothetical protein [Rhodobacteraceae phage LS06-2018-MD07]